MKRLGVMGVVFLNSRVISPPISGSFGIILVGEVSHEATKSTKEGEDGRGKRHPPPLKLWRTGKAGRTEVSREEGGLTRSHELHEGRGGWTRQKAKGKRLPPPLKLWRTGKAGRTEVSREEGGLTRSHEVHEGRGGWTRQKASAAAEARADGEGWEDGGG